jgi:hypothetical protein
MQNYLSPLEQPEPRAWVSSAELWDLSSILVAGTQVATWTRPWTAAWSGVVDAWLTTARQVRAVVDADGASPEPAALQELVAGLDVTPRAAEAWLGDVALLAELMADLTGAARVGIRVASLDDAMCPRFHVDHVTLRMVCTYRGPGTQFWRAPPGLPRLLEPPSPMDVLQARAPDVVVMKGTAFPGNRNHGAVHRSPPPDGRRLVVTLDPLE